MKRLLILIAVIFPLIGFSQQKDLTDSTEYRYGLPISNDDTVKRARSDEERARWTAVPINKIPKKLRHTLQKNDVYEGWEKGEVFFDAAIDRYLVRIREEKSVRTYGFSSSGAAVSFTEEDVVSEDSIN
jgi:hypothetical protein